MNSTNVAGESAGNGLQRVAADFLNDVYQRLPMLAVGALTLVAGWLLALLLRSAVRRLLRGGSSLLYKAFRRDHAESEASRAATALLGDLVYWVTLFVTVAMAAQVAGFNALAEGLRGIVVHLPNLLSGAAIMVVGYALSVAIGGQVSHAATATRLGQSPLVGAIAKGGIFAAAFIIGLGQMGVDVTLLVALVVVITGSILIGFSIAFGLGARDYVGDVVSARAVRRELLPGLLVQIGSLRGQVLEVTATHVVLDTALGKALMPARRVAAEGFLVLDSSANDSHE